MEVCVAQLDGQHSVLEVQPDDLVINIRTRLASSTGAPLKSFQLLFGIGWPLDDFCTLAEHEFTCGDVVQLRMQASRDNLEDEGIPALPPDAVWLVVENGLYRLMCSDGSLWGYVVVWHAAEEAASETTSQQPPAWKPAQPFVKGVTWTRIPVKDGVCLGWRARWSELSGRKSCFVEMGRVPVGVKDGSNEERLYVETHAHEQQEAFLKACRGRAKAEASGRAQASGGAGGGRLHMDHINSHRAQAQRNTRLANISDRQRLRDGSHSITCHSLQIFPKFALARGEVLTPLWQWGRSLGLAESR